MTPAGASAMAFVTDITERVRATELLRQATTALQERTVELERRAVQLSQLAAELTLAEQRAREQLAKTLHDDLLQLLFSARLKVDRLATGRASPDPPGLAARARSEIDETIAAARSLSIELFPPVLYEGSLPSALAWLAEWKQQKYGLVVQLSADPRANPERKDLRLLLFESIRELLFNVVKHANVDRVAVDLTIGGEGALEITVSDLGAGFDPAALLAHSGNHQVGLGLVSIRERLTLLGGRLNIQSAPGQGATFTLTVPPDRGAGLHLRPGPPIDRSGGEPIRPLRILLADDHAMVREGLRELLMDRPEFQVVGEAADGLEAVEQAHALRPDVMVMDVSMPKVDGVEATRRIRADLPFIQIFGLSTQERTEDLHAIEAAGAAAYFTKGADMQHLIDRLLALRVDAREAPRRTT